MGSEAVLLVGHGAVPKDAPRALVAELKQLEQRRRASGEPASPREVELEQLLRNWPRTEANDPYRAGIVRAAEALRVRIAPIRVEVAFNEFCAPSITEAIDELAAAGVGRVRVVSVMVTPGGSHSEVDIPRELQAVRKRHAALTIEYVWPVDLGLFADFIVRLLEPPSPVREADA